MSTDPTRLPDVTVDASGNLVEDIRKELASRRVPTTFGEYLAPAGSVAELMNRIPTCTLETARVLCAATAARTLARAARRQAPLAFLIRVGSEVEVKSGRRVPYGFYRVLRHYHTDLRHGNARIDVADSTYWRRSGCSVRADGRVRDRHDREPTYQSFSVAVADVKPVPDWSYPFHDWREWAVLGGVALTGFDGTAWKMLADLLEDWESIPPLPASVSEVFPLDFPPSYLAAELRDTVGHLVTGRAFHGPVFATPEVLRANENPG